MSETCSMHKELDVQVEYVHNIKDWNDIIPPPANTDARSVSFCKQTAKYREKIYNIIRGFSVIKTCLMADSCRDL